MAGDIKTSCHFSLFGIIVRKRLLASWNGVISKFSRVLFLLIVASPMLSCCAVTKIPESPYTHIIQNVPFYPQEIYQCGPASLAGVLNFWGVKVSPGEISGKIFSESARGTLNLDMVLFTNSMGLNAYQYAGDLNDIKKNINSGFPVIVLVDYGISVFEKSHFMVVKGYNNQGVIVNSGEKQDYFISDEEFRKVWKRAHYWTLLIQPK